MKIPIWRLLCVLAIISALATAEENTNDKGRMLEVECWRMLPVTPNTRDAFRKQLSALHDQDEQSAWHSVFSMYSTVLDSDRTALLNAAKALRIPKEFPNRYAEAAQMKQLREQGLSQTR